MLIRRSNISRIILILMTLPARKLLPKTPEVVKICTQYAQNGMFNIFIAIFSFAMAFACLAAPKTGNEPVALFVAYLLSIALFGLFQAVFMANAGGCWDNAKKVVEVDMAEKGTPLRCYHCWRYRW